MVFQLTADSRLKLHDIRNHMQLYVGVRELQERIRQELDELFEDAVARVQMGASREDVEEVLSLARRRLAELGEKDRSLDAAYERIVEIVFDMEDRRSHEKIALGDLVRHETVYCHSDLRRLPADRVVFKESRLVYIECSPVRVRRLIDNLIYNAAEAVSETGGGVELEVDLAGLGEPRRGLLGEIPAGPYAILTVSDEGEGLPAEMVERFLEEGWSTKKERGHSGLGLNLVRDVLCECGGNLEIAPRDERGTVVRVYFPAVDPPVETDKASGAMA